MAICMTQKMCRIESHKNNKIHYYNFFTHKIPFQVQLYYIFKAETLIPSILLLLAM